jgi:hypothetical protein
MNKNIIKYKTWKNVVLLILKIIEMDIKNLNNQMIPCFYNKEIWKTTFSIKVVFFIFLFLIKKN